MALPRPLRICSWGENPHTGLSGVSLVHAQFKGQPSSRAELEAGLGVSVCATRFTRFIPSRSSCFVCPKPHLPTPRTCEAGENEAGGWGRDTRGSGKAGELGPTSRGHPGPGLLGAVGPSARRTRAARTLRKLPAETSGSPRTGPASWAQSWAVPPGVPGNQAWTRGWILARGTRAEPLHAVSSLPSDSSCRAPSPSPSGVFMPCSIPLPSEVLMPHPPRHLGVLALGLRDPWEPFAGARHESLTTVRGF